MMRTVVLLLLAIASAQPTLAATLRVPQDHKSIQAAIDASQPRDTISVAPGKYQDRIRLKPGIVLRSAGDDAKGTDGLKRAEATVLERRVPAETFPSYDPDANPDEWVWSWAKYGKMCNLCPVDVEELFESVLDALEELQHQPTLLASFVMDAGVPLCH